METEWSGLKTLEKIILNGGSISRFIDWATRFFEKKKKLSLEGLKIGSLKLHVLTMEWLAKKA